MITKDVKRFAYIPSDTFLNPRQQASRGRRVRIKKILRKVYLWSGLVPRKNYIRLCGDIRYTIKCLQGNRQGYIIKACSNSQAASTPMRRLATQGKVYDVGVKVFKEIWHRRRWQIGNSVRYTTISSGENSGRELGYLEKEEDQTTHAFQKAVQFP